MEKNYPVSVNGQTQYLTMGEMSQIASRYHVLCIAEYIENNHESIPENIVMEIAEEAAHQEEKFGYEESEAIWQAAEVLGYKELMQDVPELD